MSVRADDSVEPAAPRVVALPARGGRALAELAGIAPSARSLLIGFGLLAASLLAYFGARQSAVFAVRAVEVEGAGPALTARVRKALATTRGTSLLALSRDDVERRLTALPGVVTASYDRAFPNTLRVFVRAERPVAVVRRGGESWLVSARARVLRPLPRGTRRALPRIWVAKEVEPAAGAMLPHDVAAAVRAAALLGRSDGARVRMVRFADGELTLVLRSFVEVRLGDTRQVRLKVAVARRVLQALAREGSGRPSYVDVTVPDRPVVAAMNPQVFG